MVLVQVTVDDMDNSPGAEPVKFSLGENSYVIDLCEKNLHRLEKALRPFIEHARQTKGTVKPPKVGEMPPDDAPEPTQQAVQAAVKSVGQRVRAADKATSAGGKAPSARPGIREWAVQEGLLPAGRGGRMPLSVEDAYDAAHATKKSAKG